MRLRTPLHAFLYMGLIGSAPAPAQDSGNWRAASSTARAITGDIAFFNQKLALGFSAFTVAQIRGLQPPEIAALFNGAEASTGSGNLYRLSIPGDKRFLHKNTLCGSEETQWAVTFANRKTLQIAFFSGAAMPILTPEAIADAPHLCGTFSYVR